MAQEWIKYSQVDCNCAQVTTVQVERVAAGGRFVTLPDGATVPVPKNKEGEKLYLLRDSKNPDVIIFLTEAEWLSFQQGMSAGFLDPDAASDGQPATDEATAIKRIYALDLTPITRLVRKQYNLDDSTIAEIEERYRQFLVLLYRYPDRLLVPPGPVDWMLDTHVLHTRLWREMCWRIFGRIVDHEPGTRDVPMLQETIGLYKKEFGVELE